MITRQISSKLSVGLTDSFFILNPHDLLVGNVNVQRLFLEGLSRGKECAMLGWRGELRAQLELSDPYHCYYLARDDFHQEKKKELLFNHIRVEEFLTNNFTVKENEEEIRVLSYNVLAQPLLEGHLHLYRHQPRHVLTWQYRHPRILQQIINYNPDVVCLQEVEESQLDPIFNSRLEEMGYKGSFKKRTGNKTDGCAIYYRLRKLSLVEAREVEYYRAGVPQLNRDNVGLALRLALVSAPSVQLTVATTHLLYTPKRWDVREAQIQVLLDQVHDMSRSYGDKESAVIICGDLNSEWNSSVIRLLESGGHTHGRPPSPQARGSQRKGGECSDGHTNRREREGELKLRSVYPYPRREGSWIQSERGEGATTFHRDWITVDYIFYSVGTRLKLFSRVRLPTPQECRNWIKYIPNYGIPSDHFPLIATFHLRTDI